MIIALTEAIGNLTDRIGSDIEMTINEGLHEFETKFNHMFSEIQKQVVPRRLDELDERRTAEKSKLVCPGCKGSPFVTLNGLIWHLRDNHGLHDPTRRTLVRVNNFYH